MKTKDLVASRRKFLKGMAATSGLAATSLLSACNSDDESSSPITESPRVYLHGVASGDPLKDRVIIWTHINAEAIQTTELYVDWQVASDIDFNNIVASGATLTDESVDHTIKIDVEGLEAGTEYYYRFLLNGMSSPIGRTRTLPEGHVDQVRFAVFSCSNYPAGYFHVYNEAAKRFNDIDFVLHLGDYIYEYPADGYASADAEQLGRVSIPEHEIVALSDYRQRYAQYRSDPDLQAVHQRLPFIAVWDDHEITNDTWREGAENHNEGEGDFNSRKARAVQVYYEWMPIREEDPEQLERIYRKFEFGDLISLYMLDTRVIGRDEQLSYSNYFTEQGFDAERFTIDISKPERTLLGAEQETWLTEAITNSSATWQILGQQVLMGSVVYPGPVFTQGIDLGVYMNLLEQQANDPDSLTEEELALLAAPNFNNLDAWDGYPVARQKVLGSLQGRNLISLAGDTHNAWASELSAQTAEGPQVVGVEFATSSVSSPGMEGFSAAETDHNVVANGFMQLSGESLKYTNSKHRGFMILSVTPTETQSEWIFVDTIKSKDYQVLSSESKKLRVLASSGEVALLDDI